MANREVAPLSDGFRIVVCLNTSVETTIEASDTLEHQPSVWPVPYACAQPYHPGSGSHGQLFQPC